MRPLVSTLIRLQSEPTRPAVCARCGAAFTQFKVPDGILTAARRGEKRNTGYFAIDRYVPDGWVPVYCPKCEHGELSSGALSVPPKSSPQLDIAYEQDERAALAEA